MLIVVIPWPPSVLSPNARVHWAKRAKAAKSYRQGCGWRAAARGLRRIDAPGGLDVGLTFHPPDRRRRDVDNMLSACKSGLDGLADLIGVDDSLWSLSLRVGQPVAGGLVVVTFEVRRI